MDTTYEPLRHDKENASSEPSMFPPTSNFPDSTSTEMPPSYSNPHQYPPASGMPYSQQYPGQAPAMGYPQSYAPPPGGQPYYPQPGVVYPGQHGFNYQASQPQNQQQQQQVIVMDNQLGGGAPVYLVNRPTVSMTGAIVLSCFAYWCFGMVFGGIAFILAMVGQSSAASGDTRSAIHLRNASYGVSIAGIVICLIAVAIAIGIIVTSVRNHNYSGSSSSPRYCSYSYNPYSGTYTYGCK